MIEQLVTFCGPQVECLLRQVAGVCVTSSQAESKLVQGAVMQLHQTLKVCSRSHPNVSLSMIHQPPFCSRQHRQGRPKSRSVARAWEFFLILPPPGTKKALVALTLRSIVLLNSKLNPCIKGEPMDTQHRPSKLFTFCLAAMIGIMSWIAPAGSQEAIAAPPFPERGDITTLPGPLKDRLIELPPRPHSYPPLTVFAE